MRSYSQDEKLREISFQYITDAHQFLTQAEIILNDNGLRRYCSYHIGYLSKVAVLLYQSIECSLKAMLCAKCIGVAPNHVYWNLIRASQHNLDKLMSQIPNIGLTLGDPTIAIRLTSLSEAKVSERYCLDVSAESQCTDNDNIEAEKLTKQISDIRKLLETAKDLRCLVWKHRQNAFKKQRVLPHSAVREALKIIRDTKPNKSMDSFSSL